MRSAPDGDFTLVRQRQLCLCFLDFARQSLAGERRVGNEPRRFRIADQIHVLDAVLFPFTVTLFDLAIQRVVRMPTGDQYQGVEFHPALAFVDLARQLAATAISALGAVAENIIYLEAS